MRQFANWTNLSETTFVLAPTRPAPTTGSGSSRRCSELPFAGHPTLGTCHAWLEAGGRPAGDGVIVQECKRRPDPDPPQPRRAGLRRAAADPQRPGRGRRRRAGGRSLNIDRADIVDIQWADNGPGWVAVLLASADAVLAIEPGRVDGDIGVAGPLPGGLAGGAGGARVLPGRWLTVEDPVTGSLNASLAQWLLAPAARRRRTWPARAPRWAAAAA